MQSFAEIRARAAARKGEALLDAHRVQPASVDELAAIADDRWLSMMAKRVFAAGFVWRVIENKWDGFEAAFGGFQPDIVAAYDDEDVERLVGDAGIVRNRQKILATVVNAGLVQATADEHGSFGAFVAAWPEDDIVGLWDFLAKRGKRLGGATGPYMLRFAGKETFLLSQDVVAALVAAGVVEKKPTGKRALAKVQQAFNAWKQESGENLSTISRVLALSIDA